MQGIIEFPEGAWGINSIKPQDLPESLSRGLERMSMVETATSHRAKEVETEAITGRDAAGTEQGGTGGAGAGSRWKKALSAIGCVNAMKQLLSSKGKGCWPPGTTQCDKAQGTGRTNKKPLFLDCASM